MAQETRSQPNILFFFTDQQRWDTVGCYAVMIQPELEFLLDRISLSVKGERDESNTTTTVRRGGKGGHRPASPSRTGACLRSV